MSDTRLSTFGPKPFGTPKPGIVVKAPAFKGSKKSTHSSHVTMNPTAIPAMPGVSSDMIKNKLASMKRTPPPPPPGESGSKFKENAPFLRNSLKRVDKSGGSTGVVVSQNELKKLSSFTANSTEDKKESGGDTTPEFLRRKLKSTGKNLNAYEKLSDNKEGDAGENNVNKQEGNVVNEKTDNSNGNSKSEFRKSLLLFESAVKPQPPLLKPKPRGNSLKSRSIEEEQAKDKKLKAINTDEELVKEKEIPDTEITSNTAEESTTESENESEKSEVKEDDEAEKSEVKEDDEAEKSEVKEDDEAEKSEVKEDDEAEKSEVTEDDEAEMLSRRNRVQLPYSKTNVENEIEVAGRPNKGVKPYNIKTIVDIPAGLQEWLTLFVLNNGSLKKLEDEILNSLPPLVQRDLKLNIVAAAVQDKNEPDPIDVEEVYDDVVQERPTNQTPAEEIYDDVDDLHKSDAVQEEEVYDDVQTDAARPNFSNETTEMNFNNESNYEIENGGTEGDELYEPVETLDIVVAGRTAQEQPTGIKKMSKREERELREREKREKKEQEEMEKRRKKEEEILEKKRKKEDEERKKREKEERKRIEKERKEFKLNPNEEPVVVAQCFIERDCKMKGKDLSLSQGGWISIISKTNAPKGKWLAQTTEGKLGYVNPKDIGGDDTVRPQSHLDRPLSVASVAFGGGEELYEDIEPHTPSSFSASVACSGFQSTIVTPLSLPGLQEEPEELYDDVNTDDGPNEDIYEDI